MTFTILLTCVGGELSSQVIHFLKNSTRHHVRVVGVDANPDAVGRHFCDSFAVVPNGDDPAYVHQIAEVCAENDVNLVLPTSDEEALALSKQRALVEVEGRQLACAPYETLSVFSNKIATYKKLESIGVAMPVWREAQNVEDLEEAVRGMVSEGHDVVVKPAEARGGRGVCVVRKDLNEIRRFSDRREAHVGLDGFLSEFLHEYQMQYPVLVMERLVEPVYDLDMLAWNGQPVRVLARRRTSSSKPNEGHTIVEDEVLYDLGKKLISEMNLSWLYDCDIMFNKAGKACVLEINPRPSGSMAVSVAAGVPLLDDLISLALGERVPDISLPLGTKIVPFVALAPTVK